MEILLLHVSLALCCQRAIVSAVPWAWDTHRQVFHGSHLHSFQVPAPISPPSESVLYNGACLYPVTVPHYPVLFLMALNTVNFILYVISLSPFLRMWAPWGWDLVCFIHTSRAQNTTRHIVGLQVFAWIPIHSSYFCVYYICDLYQKLQKLCKCFIEMYVHMYSWKPWSCYVIPT